MSVFIIFYVLRKFLDKLIPKVDVLILNFCKDSP